MAQSNEEKLLIGAGRNVMKRSQASRHRAWATGRALRESLLRATGCARRDTDAEAPRLPQRRELPVCGAEELPWSPQDANVTGSQDAVCLPPGDQDLSVRAGLGV